MKSIKPIIGMITCLTMVASAVPYTASADDTLIYGTMNIPYADFYKAELAGSTNQYDVDAVSSATTSGKWAKNGEGELFEGTYNEANEDGTGTILGVTYPVALTSETLAELGDDNYGFVETSEVPTAYKTVTIEDGTVSFSTVNGETTSFTADTTINANSVWGDYVIDVTSTPEDMGAIYGAILTTTSNESYGLRHLENIWRGELAWSVGFTTQEPHGNTLNYEDYQGLMGDTISQITYITKNGYYTLDTSIYVPVKFDGSVEVASASITDGKTTITTDGIPTDYELSYSIDGLDAQIDGDTITFSNATPASYTLSVSDANGVYMDLSTTFELTTDVTPVQYDGTSLVKTDTASDEDFANYIKNITSVSVNGQSYSASGKGAVKIIGEDGTIDTSITSGRESTPVFSGADSYTITVSSAGYSNDLEFTISVGSASEVTTSSELVEVTTAKDTSTTTDNGNVLTPITSSDSNTTSSGDSTNTNNNNSNSNNSSSTSSANTNSATSTNSTTSPDTGSKGVAVPLSMLAVATAFIASFSKKNKD